MRSNVGSHGLINPKGDDHTSNSLQDIRQNHWTMKHGSRRPIFIFRSNIGSHGLIIPKFDVHASDDP